MKRRNSARGVCSLATMLVVSAAAAQLPGGTSGDMGSKTLLQADGIRVTAGVRIWANEWEIPDFERVTIVTDPTDPGSVVLRDVVTTRVSDVKVVAMPTVAVRAGKFIGSVSYFPRTGYDSGGAVGTVRRDEFDVSVGYSIPTPPESSLFVSLAYKHVDVGQTSAQLDNSTKIDAALLGVGGSAPLTERFGLYGNLAYGLARQKLNSTPPPLTADEKSDATYLLAEVGVSYVLFSGRETQPLRSLALTAGYRTQVYTIDSVPQYTFRALPTPTLIDTQTRDVRSTTQGVVIGVIATF